MTSATAPESVDPSMGAMGGGAMLGGGGESDAAPSRRLRPPKPKPQPFDARKLDLAVLGYMLVNPGKYYELADVREEHLGTPMIRRMFAVIRGMQEGSDGPGGIGSEAAIVGRATQAGIPETEAAMVIAEARDHAPRDASALQSIKAQLLDHAMRRVAEEIAGRLQEDADNRLSADEITERLSGYTTYALKHAQSVPVKSLGEELDKEILRISSPDTGIAMGYRTGLTALDDMLGGLHGGEMFIIAARPGMGKSSLANHMVKAMGFEQNLPGGVLSLEMRGSEYAQRLICNASGMNIVTARRNAMSEKARERYLETARKLKRAQVKICDTGGISLPQIQATVRRWYYEDGIKWLILDYLQLVDHRQRRAETTNDAITRTSAAMKAMALQLDIPIVVLSQLNRGPESRGTKPEDKRPMMSDLRSSGSIEQDADVVLLLFRESYYWSKEAQDAAKALPYEKAEIIVAKQRNGPTGSIDVAWIKECAGFDDWSESQYPLP